MENRINQLNNSSESLKWQRDAGYGEIKFLKVK
jgi:hypothetical protein